MKFNIFLLSAFIFISCKKDPKTEVTKAPTAVKDNVQVSDEKENRNK